MQVRPTKDGGPGPEDRGGGEGLRSGGFGEVVVDRIRNPWGARAASMEGMLSELARTLKPSPIQELSHLAQRCGAINLAEGFPDFPAPAEIKNAAISAINSDFNQYRCVWASVTRNLACASWT